MIPPEMEPNIHINPNNGLVFYSYDKNGDTVNRYKYPDQLIQYIDPSEFRRTNLI